MTTEKSRWDHFVDWIGKQKIVSDVWSKFIVPIDRRLVRWTRGRLTLMIGKPVGLLTTIGRKSGLPRENPIMYITNNENVILIASNFGKTNHPAWVLNLIENPEVTFVYRGKKQDFRARITEGDERSQLWELAQAEYEPFRTYEQRADNRQINVVILEPSTPKRD